jgi:hypothetical protein
MQESMSAASDREMVALCSGLKFYSTRAAADALQVRPVAGWGRRRDLTVATQTCRECCGGQGFMSENLIAGMRADQVRFVAQHAVRRVTQVRAGHSRDL